MNARGHGRQVGLAPFALNETHERDFFAIIARALATDARSRRPAGAQRLGSAAETHVRLGTL